MAHVCFFSGVFHFLSTSTCRRRTVSRKPRQKRQERRRQKRRPAPHQMPIPAGPRRQPAKSKPRPPRRKLAPSWPLWLPRKTARARPPLPRRQPDPWWPTAQPLSPAPIWPRPVPWIPAPPRLLRASLPMKTLLLPPATTKTAAGPRNVAMR